MEIMDAVRRHFGNRIPFLIAEPGRGLVGNAGVIQTEVVLIARKGDGDARPWVYLDVGKFGGLAETMDEAIQYPIVSDRKGAPVPVILAGPTCDSADVLYERSPYALPEDLQVGDRLEIGHRRLHHHLRRGRLQRLRPLARLLRLAPARGPSP